MRARGIIRLPAIWLVISLLLVWGGCTSNTSTPAVDSRPEDATITASPTSSQTVSATPTPSAISSPIPTETIMPSATATRTPTPMPTSTPTPTSMPTLTMIQAIAEAVVPARDPPALAERLRLVPGPIPRIVNDTPPQYEVGDKDLFWVGNDEAGAHFPVTATLRIITPHLHMWVEEGYEVNEEDLRRSAERFENETYPTNRSFFGSEWTPGVDNDPHISIFNGRVPGVAGYFYSPSEYSRLVNPFSNEREMFFINLDVRKPGTDAYDATLTHEFQHMIHWYNDANEDTWVNEGMSMLAEQLNGFSVSVYANAYLAAPDTQLTTWAIAEEDSIPHYGASYLFMSYALERLGLDTLKSIVRAEANGTAGFDDVLGRLKLSARFDDLFADWVIANYLDDAMAGEGHYGYADLEIGRPAIEEHHAEYPASASGSVHQYGVDYILLEGTSEGDLTIEFAGEPDVLLAPMNIHGGQWAWWSNRGDDSDTTLTRSFDLRGVETATLSAWMWYDIESDWDYAYMEISVDGGKAWSILETASSVTSNPNGNSLGPAYTGMSGGGETPLWIEERVDLTPYAGQEVMLRFELVTDDAVNHPGLFIDDISIPEIDYSEGFEAGDGRWEAAGFLRTDNRLPQRYLVQLIQFENGRPVIRRMELNGLQVGTLELVGLGSEVTEAVLVVSALAPATTELAHYQYTIRASGQSTAD